MTAEPGSLLNVVSIVASERARNSSIGSSVVDVFSMMVGFSSVLWFSFLLANGLAGGAENGEHRLERCHFGLVTYYISRIKSSLPKKFKSASFSFIGL